MQWDCCLPKTRSENVSKGKEVRWEKTWRRSFECEISDSNRTSQTGHPWNKSLLPLRGLWKEGKVAQLWVAHVRELKLSIVEFLAQVWVAGWEKMVMLCIHHNREVRECLVSIMNIVKFISQPYYSCWISPVSWWKTWKQSTQGRDTQTL